MSQISAEKIKELRDRTGVGMSKCKEALQEAGGDMDQAIDYLRKLGMASAVKKEGRETKEGLIGSVETTQAVALVEVNTETDFVAQNERFKHFLHEICIEAAQSGTTTVEQLLSQTLKDGKSIDEYRTTLMQSLGENIKVKRILVLPKSQKTSVGLYSHMGGKIVCVVELEGASGQEALAKDLAMHVAAEAPEFLSSEEIPESLKEREREIARTQVQGKPAAMMDKIVEGKMSTFYEQVVLPMQKFVKDSSVRVGEHVSSHSKKLGSPIHIKRFIRWKIGE